MPEADPKTTSTGDGILDSLFGTREELAQEYLDRVNGYLKPPTEADNCDEVQGWGDPSFD